ncbi:MAG: uncharacterized protein K0Q49_2083 [Haloplasmataceae bacterium]|jgi:hypothetical protein|nr:uncharacterized protein [Haloplasmataceae bacterium]
MSELYGLEVQPLLSFITCICIFTYVLKQFVDKQKVAEWIVNYTSNDKDTLFKLDHLSKERRSIESERNKLSAQDNYAKWTKLNRKLDNLNNEITELSNKVKSTQTTQLNTIKSIIMFFQKVPIYFIRFWYSRTPVIILYTFSLPFPFSKILSMPWGKNNTVSAFFWCLAIETVLNTIYNFYKDLKNYRKLSVIPISNKKTD